MSKKIILVIIAMILIAGVIGGVWLYLSGLQPEQSIEGFNKLTKSEVKAVNGVPKLFVNGEEFDAVFTQIYQYPVKLPGNINYGPDWVSEVKDIIDESVELDTNVILLHIWWNELDESTSRPNDISDNLYFKPLDEVMDYATEKSVYIMLLPEMHKMIPDWWLIENDFPFEHYSPCVPTEKETDTSCIPQEICSEEVDGPRCCTDTTEELLCCNIKRDEERSALTTEDGELYCSPSYEEILYKQCEFCETDSYGWKFNYPSMGNEKAREDYGEYVATVIDKYKNHPSLIGWGFGIGSTAEDVYGPDYTQLMGIYNDLYFSHDGYQLADYSPYFQEEYKRWLKTKYGTDESIRRAWNDNNVSLNGVEIPSPQEFFKTTKENNLFPDNFVLKWLVSPNDLTKKGQDFYEFREYMKSLDHDYYTKLFKNKDPNHVLFFSTWNNENLYQNKLVDGFWSNPRINYERDRLSSYIWILLAQKLAINNGKYAFSVLENVYETSQENQNQINALESAGKSTKCFDGFFGYVSEFTGDNIQMPSWSTESDKKAIKKIISYIPDSDCACNLINQNDKIFDMAVMELLEIFDITEYDCSSQDNLNSCEDCGINQVTPVSGCGDGVCDEFEQNNPQICPNDCE